MNLRAGKGKVSLRMKNLITALLSLTWFNSTLADEPDTKHDI